MNEVITVLAPKRHRLGLDVWWNDITRAMDQFNNDLLEELSSGTAFDDCFCHSYIQDIKETIKNHKEENMLYFPFRTPGSTKGHIAVNKELVIQDIKFYPETSFNASLRGDKTAFKPEVEGAMKHFIGSKIILNEEE